MRVGGDAGLIERIPEHDECGLSADTRKLHERVQIGWHVPVMMLDEGG